MPSLNAIDAIAPAWAHTRTLLLRRPLNWRLLLKVGLIATFAQIGGCNANFNLPGNPKLPAHPGIDAAALFGFLVIAAVAVILFSLVFFYLSSRLQLVLFGIVLYRSTTVAPLWRHYGAVTWRWIGLKVIFFLAILVCLAPILTPVLLHFIHAMPKGSAAPANVGALLAAIFGFFAGILVLATLIAAADALVSDFALPSIALEATPASQAFRRLWALIRSEPGPILFYLLMRFILRAAGMLCGYIPLALGSLILLLPLGGIGFTLWTTLHHGGPAARLAMIAGWVVLGLIFAAAFVLAFATLFGILFVFMQAYALYFLAGRYPMLAATLYPAPPPMPSPA